jgi:O-antigen/teichoic acid export membrane protein
MTIARTITRNIASNWAGFAVNLAVIFFLTPIIIAHLGGEAYGLWLMLHSFVGYYGLVDMGLRAGIVQTITRRIADNDSDSVRRHVGAALPALAMLGGLLLLIATILAWAVASSIDVSEELRIQIIPVVLLSAASFCIQMMQAPYQSVLTGLQRFDIDNVYLVASRLISAVLTVGVLWNEGGLVGLACVTLLMAIFDGGLRWFRARRMYPALVGLRWIRNDAELKELWKAGFWNTMTYVSRQLIFFSDAIVITYLIGSIAVVPFGIAGSMIGHCNRLVTLSVRVLFPAMANLRSSDDVEKRRRLYFTMTRLVTGVSVAATICGSVLLTPFVKLWLSNTDVLAAVQSQTPVLFLVLGCASIFVSFQRSGTQLLLAEGKIRSVAILYSGEALCNLVVSIGLGLVFGVVGIAIGTLLPAALFATFGHLPRHAEILHLPKAKVFAGVMARPALFAVCLSGFSFLYSRLFYPDGWPQFLGCCIVHGCIAISLLVVLLLEHEQRQVFLSAPGKLVRHLRRPIANSL